MTATIAIKRVYDPPAARDGKRILVDRLWPRGLSKDEAALDGWLRDIAPSTGLRKWFGHEPERWAEFRRRYLAELAKNPEVAQARQLLKSGRATLLFAAHDAEHNQAVVLAEFLGKPRRRARAKAIAKRGARKV